jgi:hypothetical protein
VLRGAQQLAEKFHLNAGNVPQRLKPDLFVERSGAAEAAPFQNGLQTAFFRRLCAPLFHGDATSTVIQAHLIR